MNLLTLINALEQTPLKRRVVATNTGETISYHNQTDNPLTITINTETTYNNLIQILIHPETIRINHTIRRNYVEINIGDITTLEVS